MQKSFLWCIRIHSRTREPNRPLVSPHEHKFGSKEPKWLLSSSMKFTIIQCEPLSMPTSSSIRSSVMTHVTVARIALLYLLTRYPIDKLTHFCREAHFRAPTNDQAPFRDCSSINSQVRCRPYRSYNTFKRVGRLSL
jgi:hypothetical protein